jgi:hypothetical protein
MPEIEEKPDYGKACSPEHPPGESLNLAGRMQTGQDY